MFRDPRYLGRRDRYCSVLVGCRNCNYQHVFEFCHVEHILFGYGAGPQALSPELLMGWS